MDTKLWADLHGGSTHFPIAMMIASVIFDGIAVVRNREPGRRDLHAAGFYTLLLGALVSLGAVLSGLMLAGGEFTGAGVLGQHHKFLWPAFGLLVGLTVWRLVVRDKASRLGFSIYLVAAAVAALLFIIAGYYGGILIGGGG